MTSGFLQNINTILAVLTICLVLYYSFLIRRNDNCPIRDSGNVKDKDTDKDKDKDKDSLKKAGDLSKVDSLEKEVHQITRELSNKVAKLETNQKQYRTNVEKLMYVSSVMQDQINSLY